MISGHAGRQSSFVNQIEDIVWQKDVTYIDAVIDYCVEKKIEIESVSDLIKSDRVLLAKIEAEAQDLRFLPKSAKLPF